LSPSAAISAETAAVPLPNKATGELGYTRMKENHRHHSDCPQTIHIRAVFHLSFKFMLQSFLQAQQRPQRPHFSI